MPLFFYHVPKTGGVSFSTALRCAIEAVQDRTGRTDALVGHTASVARLDRPPADAAFYERRFALVSSHLAYGIHRRFGHEFRLATILRDPVDRVRSEYTYACMRRGEPVSAEGFCAHFRSEAHIDRAAKQLAGHAAWDRPAPPGLAARAIAHLESDFESFVTAADIADLIRQYLSVWRLPNVLMDRLNVTQPAYRLDSSPWVAEIAALNAEDGALYRYVRDHSRLPALASAGVEECDGFTVVINETDNGRRTAGRFALLPTGEVARTAPRVANP